MILPLARTELTILRRSRQAWWPLVALGLLVLLSFAGASLEAARGNADKRAIAAAERARWLGQGEKDPHSAAHYSVFAFKPAPALAGLDPGATPFLGQAVWLEAHHQNDLLHRPRQNASLLERAGLASPAALLLGFGPLIVFLLAFVGVAADRERGTMRLALGAASHPRAIVYAKALAIWGAAAGILVLPTTLLALAGALIGGSGSDTLARLMLWALLMSAYLGLLAAIGVTVALRSTSARFALALSFALWIVLALILPRAASSAADGLRPLPSSQAIKQRMLDEAPAYWSAEDGVRHEAELLARYGVERIEDIPNPRMAELDLVERHSHRVFDRLLGPFYARVKAQDRAFAWLGLFSPTVAGQSLSASLAGSDFSHHHDFIASAERYRRDLVNRMNADGMAHSAHGTERHVNDVRLWSQIPDFGYHDPALGPPNSTALPALGALALWLVAAWRMLGASARRLRP